MAGKTLACEARSHCGSVAALCPACDGWAVRSGSVAKGRMRFVLGLTIIGAAAFIGGLMLLFVGETQRLKSPHSGQRLAQTGELIAVAGLVCGVALLAVLTISLTRGAGRTRRRPERILTGTIVARPPSLESADTGEWLRPLPAAGPPQGTYQPQATYHQPQATYPAQATYQPQPAHPAQATYQPQATSRPHAAHPPQAAQSAQAAYAYPPRPEPVAEQARPGADYADTGWQPEPGQDWSPGPAYAWESDRQDEWGRGDEWNGEVQDGWDMSGQQEWAPDQQQWAPGGQPGWVPGQPDWVPGSQPGWVPGPQGWVPAAQGWEPQSQQEWVAGGQQDWAPGEQQQWGPGPQGDWGPGAQHAWNGEAQDRWVPEGEQQWHPGAGADWSRGGHHDQADGRGGWDEQPDGWGFTEPPAGRPGPYLADP